MVRRANLHTALRRGFVHSAHIGKVNAPRPFERYCLGLRVPTRDLAAAPFIQTGPPVRGEDFMVTCKTPSARFLSATKQQTSAQASICACASDKCLILFYARFGRLKPGKDKLTGFVGERRIFQGVFKRGFAHVFHVIAEPFQKAH